MKAEPSLSHATPQGLLVPSANSSKSRVLGWILQRAQVKSKVFPLCFTTERLKTPLSPYNQPSGPHVIVATESGDDDLALISLAVAIGVLKEEDIRRVRDPDSARSHGDA
jgi:hypothetical protein